MGKQHTTLLSLILEQALESKTRLTDAAKQNPQNTYRPYTAKLER